MNLPYLGLGWLQHIDIPWKAGVIEMPELLLRDREIRTVFQLLGERENDMTFSIAWALAKSARFSADFVKAVLGIEVDGAEVTIRIQVSEKNGGITDVEMELPNVFFIVIEAKKGWTVPPLAQLAKYAKRKSLLAAANIKRAIVPLSECTSEFIYGTINCKSVHGIPIIPFSWQQLLDCATNTKYSAHAEKRLFQELAIYLRGVISMQSNDSNWVYVVSLGAGTPSGWTVSWIDIIKTHRKYFHLIGTTWPKQPPNYIAFRYGGRLQSIHHIESVEVFTDPHSQFKGIPDRNWKPHFLYKLGPNFAPNHEVPTGKIYPSGRVWCMLDTLFTSATIADARDTSKKRTHGIGSTGG